MRKSVGVVLGCLALVACNLGSTKKEISLQSSTSKKAVVYFTRDISPEGLVKIYDKISQDIQGKVAIKIHTGEPHGPNILPRPMVKALQEHIANSNLVETNTLYEGGRSNTKKHRETLKVNGWDFCPVDIMDENGYAMLPIVGGKHFTQMAMGKNILNYDSMVVLTHFKGHTMGGYGGSLKNIAIGCADGKVGKAMIHGSTTDNTWATSHDAFQENMVESAKAVVDHFGKQIVFINVLRNMSVDCDCAGTSAAPVKASDIGVLASIDLAAIDKASIDKVYSLPEHELHDLKERIESRSGLRQLSYMKELGMGTGEYEIVDLDTTN